MIVFDAKFLFGVRFLVLLLATLARSKSKRERRGAAPFCHRHTTSESFWSRSDSGPHRSA